jgi:transcriptional regulator with XRE-family HTH domain
MTRRRKYKPLPPRELAICRRVREARLREGISQRLLAEEIGRTRDQLANVEGGRVPLRFGLAWDLCRHLDLNPLWLLDRDSNRGVWVKYDFPTGSEDALFSDVLLGCIQDYRIARENFLESRPQYFANEQIPSGGLPAAPLDEALSDYEERFERHMERAAKEFRRNTSVQKDLTRSARGARFGAMRKSASSLWSQLRGRLASATSGPGEKARLAREIGVSRQAVSEWITRRKNAPSSETTLRLLAWVTEAEAQQKNRTRRAETPRAQKTPKSKSTSHEKAKSNQQEE